MDERYITHISPHDPRVVAAVEAERKLFDHYGLSYTVHQVELDEPKIRVRVLDVGMGKPVLLIPGGSGDAWQFAPLLAHLTGWRLIVVNRPGGGLSDGVDYRQVDLRRFAVQTLSAVLDAFDLHHLPVIGNSFGGLWAFWLALAQPSRVSALAQLGCPALLLGTSAPFFMRLLGAPGLGQLLVGQLQPRRGARALDGLRFQGSRREAIAALPPALAEATYAFARLPTYRQSWRTLIAAATTLRGARRQYRLEAGDLNLVHPPVQLIWGDADPFGSLDVARRAAQMLSRAEMHELAAGHLPHIDNPAGCARLIQPFLASHAPRLGELAPTMRGSWPQLELIVPTIS